ncbi:hypothetical protein GCM10028806_54410 [Spirosoma terrae]|uniref:Caspase family p20 domain-containing protein n=1 Tax=Spirosoma terrae TaxID=1968276 RepID=A0A6L9LE20_9BACT|nr:caspase domain-containing protein [Spirosoma terrae]NDU96758.1 hypothetical protein [Spirosoma terrae]
MKTYLLITIGFLLSLITYAQESETTISTSRSGRQKLNTQGLFTPETVAAPQITFQMGNGESDIVQTDHIIIKACIKTSKPLIRLELFVNDVLQQLNRDLKVTADPQLVSCEHSVAQAVQLQEGSNKIRLVAYNSGGNATNSFLIRYEKPAPIVQEKRLALVIGNANYPSSNRLANPANDAEDMSKALKNVGFEVMQFTDLDNRSMLRAINEFGTKLKDYQVGLFYYAGHGVQSKGRNYLVPIDAKPTSEGEIEYDCFLADRILTKMEDAHTRTNIVVLDACRDNPFERSWSRGGDEKGLSAMNGPSGTYLAFATSPGKTAADGTARNGLYTAMLLKYLSVPGLSIESVFKQVRLEVMKQSNNRQTPWELSSLIGDFYFMSK